MELSDAKRMKEADREAIEGRGIPSLLLMERASALVGRAAALLAGVPAEALEEEPACPPDEASEPEPESAPEAAEEPAPEPPCQPKKRSLWQQLFCPPEPPAPKAAETIREPEPAQPEEPAEEPAPDDSDKPAPSEEMSVEAKRAVVFSGPGNNGGDGIGAAVYLRRRGFSVRAFLVGERGKMTPDSLAMEQRLTEAGGALEPFVPGDADIEAAAKGADVLIDTLFGVGLSRPVAGEAQEEVRLINSSG
ncbi:MAG: NAD(P)H-hydrate epimerase [Oscillospiraceae bacterium]|nr:NAD(P)H-hydrate epimerase [Oscillospiraceae bacterium]